jgi:hypothetical protein
MKRFQDSGHLFRLAAVFLAVFVAFIAVRAALVPKSFGEYGHYRGAALEEIAAHPINYAGHQTCETCHSDVAETKAHGRHAHVNCETCHGPLAKHADDPSALTPTLPDTALICARCHQQNIAKPAHFPQVDAPEHSSGVACKTCHAPHSPAIADATATAKSKGGK